MSKLSPFHLAIPVNDLDQCRVFYREVLGLKEGRSSDNWVDFNFFGHQLVIHFDNDKTISKKAIRWMGKKYQYHIMELY